MDSPVKKSSDGDKEIMLLDYLIVLAKHARMIIYSSFAVTVLAMIILLLISNKYTSTARIMPPQQNFTLSAQILDQLGGTTVLPTVMAGGGAGGMAALLGLKSPGDLYVGMLSGNTIFDRIIDQFKLRDEYKSWITSGFPPIEDLREKLNKMVDISSSKEGLILIDVTDKDPQRAAAMANAFVEELDKLLQEMALKEARDRLVFLEKERNKAVLNLAKAEEDLRAFSERSNVLQIDAQTRGMLDYVANLRAQIDAKEIQIQVMRQQATPANYDVIRLDTELQGLKKKLQETEAKESISPRCGDIMIATSKVPALGLEYVRLYREAKYQEGLYQLFCKLTEIAHLDMVREASIVQVVDRGTTPEKKSKPKRIIMSVLIGFMAMLGLIFYSFFSEYWQNLKNEEAGRVTQLKYYGNILMQDARYLRSLLRWKRPKS